MKTPHFKTKISVLTYSCVMIFGIGSWIAVCGIWVELPNLVNETPEGWKLASYLAVICQMANIGPLVYSVIKSKTENKAKVERQAVYILLLIGSVACILLSMFWKKTSFIFNKERSTALMALVFVIALVDCTSSVTFLPFMSILPAIYMSPFYIGETLSAFLPSLVALAQGVDDYPSGVNSSFAGNTTHESSNGLRFPQMVFFIVLAILMLACVLSFAALNYHPSIRRVHVKHQIASDINGNDASLEKESLLQTNMPAIDYYSSRNLSLLLFWMIWLNFIQNGIFSSISSYACAPYGTFTYHLAIILGNMSCAFASVIYLWVPNKSTKMVTLLSAIYSILSSYLVWMALLSPHPLLQDKIIGKIIIVLVAITSGALVAYSKLSIASIMRYQGHKYLFYAGISNQVGSFVGAILMFPIVNYTTIFKSS